MLEKEKVLRILYVGDSPTVNTGFGTVSKNVLEQLHKRGHEISLLAVNYYGDPYDGPPLPYKIWPGDKGNMDMVYGYAKLWWIEKKVKPDLIFMLNDPWIIEKYINHRPPEVNPSLKYMAYYPLDSAPLKPSWANMLSDLDAQVCYSKYAEQIVVEANGGKRPKNLYQVYHGVDTETFKPVNQQLAREKLGLPKDMFVVGMVARNQYRKRFDLLVKAFAEFAKDKTDVKLYLHTALEDVGYDIADLIRQYGISDKLILTEGLRVDRGVDSQILNLIYNSFSVNCLISLGDGFGLPVAESMATGCPQLVSDHSCLKELVEGHGGLTVKNAASILNTNGINTWGIVSDSDDIVKKLNILYKNSELRMQLSEEGYKFITQSKFNWDYIGGQFHDIIQDMFHIMR